MLTQSVLVVLLAAVAPPDHSLPAKDYVALGMSAPDRTWAPRDYEAAASVVEKQAAKDPTQLPRHGSSTSGRVFARLTSVTDFAALARPMPTAQRMALATQMLAPAQRILMAYIGPATRGMVLDRELAECFGLLLAVAAETVETADEFSAQVSASDPQRKTRLEGLERVRSGMSEIVAGSLVSITERDTYGLEARRALARHVGAFGPRLIARMSETQRAEALRCLDELIIQEDDDQIRASLRAVRASRGSVHQE